ncbi:HTTM domain-containing protein [Curtobacterium sp. MCBD17_032]|nr:HTTM domain-containing protein [Curtobacterium sp. MCBD17_032]
MVLAVLTRGWGTAEHWLLDSKKAQYGISVTRMLIGVHGMLIIAANFSTRYYAFGAGSFWDGQHAYPGSDFARIWVFSWFPFIGASNGGLTFSLVALFVLALLVALGWRTKFVLPVYGVFFVSWMEMNDLLSDQSDNMLRMVMIYMLFADSSIRLSLDARRRTRSHAALRTYAHRVAAVRPYNNLLHNLVLVVMTLHVGFVYMSGALYKAQGQTWANGYAVYNPLHVDRFSTWPELADAVTSWGPAVVAISWGTIIVQMMFLPMLINRVTRILALLAIMGFHLGIGFFMGLPFFSLAMIAIDAIFIRDTTWKHLGRAVRSAWQSAVASTPGREVRPAAATSVTSASGPIPTGAAAVTTCTCATHHHAAVQPDPAWVGAPTTSSKESDPSAAEDASAALAQVEAVDRPATPDGGGTTASGTARPEARVGSDEATGAQEASDETESDRASRPSSELVTEHA